MGNLRANFDNQLNEFLSRFGLKRGELILRSILEKPKSTLEENKKRHLCAGYTIEETAKAYGITSNDVIEGRGRRAAEARSTVINLLKTYTKTTYRELTQLLNIKRRAVAYANRKCLERLEVPRFEKDFNERHRAIEIKLIAFITKI